MRKIIVSVVVMFIVLCGEYQNLQLFRSQLMVIYLMNHYLKVKSSKLSWDNTIKNIMVYKVKYNCNSNYDIGDIFVFEATIAYGYVTSLIKNFNIPVTVDIENYCYQ